MRLRTLQHSGAKEYKTMLTYEENITQQVDRLYWYESR